MQCAQERIEAVQEVYQKHWSEDKISKDGLKRTSKKESTIVKRDTQSKLTISGTPRRLLAPKSLSYALKGDNKQQAMNGKNNVGLELVKPVHNFDANGFDDGIVSTMDKSVINSPMLQKNGIAYFEQQTITTTTTTTKTIMMQRFMAQPGDETHDFGPISVGTYQRKPFLNSQIKLKLIKFFSSNS